MLNSEKLAIAAHLHVLLRRKTGRVTDTEWLASNAEYASEIIRFSLASAQKDGHADLAEWAGKLAQALPQVSLTQSGAAGLTAIASGLPLKGQTPSVKDASGAGLMRYVRGIR